jgi:hypothetical protein
VFVATTLLYPCALAALCVGAGSFVDRLAGRFLPAPLLLSVGAAALIALSQLLTYVPALAPATPYAMVAVALAGVALAPARARELAARWRSGAWLALACAAVYLLALAPVLAAGRTSFSSFMALSDSAVHMLGADFLIRHGQHYAHLDLRNSYGQFLAAYYNTGYPSGADTLFGGSAFLLGLPLIWAFQPFNAFMLAAAAGPAWSLARAMGLAGGWAALAVVTAVLPALVYAYELLGSIKEITALTMILALGALVVGHRGWLGRGPAHAVPFALTLAAGVSALGVAFGAWALASVVVLAVVLVARLRQGSVRLGGALAQVGAGAGALLVAAWPTWVHLPASIRVAQNIATTGNSGNLAHPLRAVQVLGVWLRGSYKLAPAGAAGTATHLLIALVAAAAALGVVHLLRLRAYALAGWIALTLVASLVVTEAVSTWAEAKALVLTSPLAMLLAWGGVAALLALPRRSLARAVAALAAVVLAGGVLASDALLYHASNLAPTARYRELASLNARFARGGPTLFTDFDEYSLYELRDLDVGGPDFVYPPPAAGGGAGGYGSLVDLDRVSPLALLDYPLIVTRRDPLASRPPSAYRLLWQGSYYQVWGRRPGARAATVHVGLSGPPARQCASIGAVARRAGAGDVLVAAQAPGVVSLSLARAAHPARWGHQRAGLVMSSAGRLTGSVRVPAAGVWDVWLQGQLMPAVQVRVDGRRVASIAGQLSGNSLVPDTVPAVRVRLTAGEHRISVTRAPASMFAPGDGGAAVLDAVFLTPVAGGRATPTPAAGDRATLRAVAPSRWRTLCGRSYQWVELVRSIGART